MSTTALTDPRAQVPQALAEKVLLGGDLSHLTVTERLSYYNAVCTSLNLNPLTRPFEYLTLGKGDEKKMILYARKDCTDQLRTERGVSVQIVSREIIEGVAVVTAQAKDMTERTDESIGAVPVVQEEGEWKTGQSGKSYFSSFGTYKQLSPLDRANAIMKAETKAKRRVTLSICGLGVFDESEIEGVTDAKKMVHAEETEKPRLLTGAEMLADLEKREPPTELETQLRDSLKAQEEKKGRHDKPVDNDLEDARKASGPVGSANQDAPALTYQDYVTRVKASESVRECSTVGNAAEADESLTQEEHKALRVLVSTRMAELSPKKK